MKTIQTVTVTLRALVQRINRQLIGQDEQLRKARSRDQHNIGQWFIPDLHHNAVCRTHVDPEELGRKLGVVRDWETVTE